MLFTASHILSDSLIERSKNLVGIHKLCKYDSVHLIYFPLCTLVIWCLKHKDAAAESQRKVAPIQALCSFKHQTLTNSRLLFI